MLMGNEKDKIKSALDYVVFRYGIKGHITRITSCFVLRFLRLWLFTYHLTSGRGLS